MNIRVQQLNPIIGDIDGNTALIKEAMAKAEDSNVDLLLLPELATCGYSPMDLLERPDFLEAVYAANKRIAEYSNETAVVWGTVTPHTGDYGRKCFNSALFAHRGEVKEEVHKSLLPTYDVYDELRYFEPGKSIECVEFKGRKLGITICEDIWCNFGDSQYVGYNINPVEKLAEGGAEAILNLSASPYTKGKPDTRLRMLQGQVQRVNLPVFYANQVGGNTELVSDGDSMVINSNAEVVSRAPLFREAFIEVEWDKQGTLTDGSTDTIEETPDIEQMFDALVLGLKDYMKKSGVADRVVLGLSGGIDSTLGACIAVEALGAENVVGITMPSEFSSTGSVTDSQKLAKNLGIEFHQITIKEIYEQFKDSLKGLFEGTSFGVAEENLQPRVRSTLLMAYSNKFGAMLLNTGNKSELATGYSTLYGDMAGGLALISDVYKTDVYKMARWLNESHYRTPKIPQDIITKPPSAELRPDQKDSDTLPDYDILDPILQAYIEEHCSKEEIINQEYARDTVNKVLSLVDRVEFKRFQTAPGLKVTDKAFGSGRRWPVVQGWSRSRK